MALPHFTNAAWLRRENPGEKKGLPISLKFLTKVENILFITHFNYLNYQNDNYSCIEKIKTRIIIKSLWFIMLLPTLRVQK